jgi:hypothetical protein
LPSTIISTACINCLISSQRYFIRLNITILAAICALLIVFTPANIELRASLPHLNANTYSTFGAYLLLATVTYPSTKLWGHFISLGCILLALAVLSYANSVGISLILLLTLIFALFSRSSNQTKGLVLLSIFMVIATIFFSKFNEQEITISDRAITLVTNTSSTMYDRWAVYKYAVQNFWDHFFIGSYYYLPGILTAHNVVIEIFLISGFFGAALFCYLAFISSLRWLAALTKGNEALNFIALLYFFSLVEALFRGRLVYSVLLVVLMAASFDRSFAKFINEKKKNYNESS